jgi:DnaK suppressor protein
MNKQELAHFKNRLLKLRKRLVHDVDAAEEALREDIAKPGELSHLPTHPADHDSEGLDEQIAIAENEEQLLAEIEEALARIEAGTFGICEDCGRPIPSERLNAIPYASRCVQCAQRHDKQQEQH